MEGITWWDFADSGWLNAPGGLIRKDGSSKPAYEELLKLVKGEWWISSKRQATDRNGRTTFTGVLGEYELTYERFRKPFSVTGNKENDIEIRL